jgi:adenosylcobyric acid synthase
VRVRWVEAPRALGDPDVVVLPGSRSVATDLEWLRAGGLAGALASLRDSAVPPVVLGVCGGYQMLGGRIDDPLGVEGTVETSAGMGWLPVDTTFAFEKTTRLRVARGPEGDPVHGYEIRHGRTLRGPGWTPWLEADTDTDSDTGTGEHVISARDECGTVLGTSLHGLFEDDAFRSAFLSHVAGVRNRSWKPSGVSFAAAREAQIDRIADACAEHLDLERLWGFL